MVTPHPILPEEANAKKSTRLPLKQDPKQHRPASEHQLNKFVPVEVFKRSVCFN
jgi:hypothetical protein